MNTIHDMRASLSVRLNCKIPTCAAHQASCEYTVSSCPPSRPEFPDPYSDVDATAVPLSLNAFTVSHPFGRASCTYSEQDGPKTLHLAATY